MHINRASAVFLAVVGVLVSNATLADAQLAGSCEPPTASSTLDVANVRATIYANGNPFWRADQIGVGYEVPKGSGLTPMFASGLWIGGKVHGELRVAASRYGPTQFWTGPLDESGSPPPNCSLFDHIWNVRRADIAAFDTGSPPTPDLRDWPTGLGAPTLSPKNADGSATSTDGIDNDADGLIDEVGELRSITDEVLALPLNQRIDQRIDLGAGERPDILGDQMLWWIMNDVGNEKVYYSREDGSNRITSPPIGLEVHASAFAFALPGDVRNATYHRLRIFNKTPEEFEDAYIGLFVDPDLGNFDDDYVASDTTHGLGIVYNADNDDESDKGYGDGPPAMAYDFLQGPLVESADDTATVFRGVKVGFRKLQMTSFIVPSDPPGVFPDPWNPLSYYNYMQAFWRDGSPLTIGDYGRTWGQPPTKYMYPADPTSGEYWSEFSRWTGGTPSTADPPGDRRFVMSSGPFRIESGREQDIFYGITWARGENNLDSYTQTKRAARTIQLFFDSGLRGREVIVEKPRAVISELEWSRLFPSPGRGVVTLEYSIPGEFPVLAEVYDAAGRRVVRLADGVRAGGLNRVAFNTEGWASGVYFLRLSVNSRTPGVQRFVVR